MEKINDITVCILARDEADSIKRTIKSAISHCQVLVIDDNSIDETTSVSRKLGAKVYTRALNSNFSAQRNFAISKVNTSWVLFLDADEFVNKSFWIEVKTAIKNGKFDGYFIKRKDVFNNKTLKFGEWGNTSILRLARKNKGKWKRKVHEYWDIKGKIGTIETPILHESHENIESFLNSISYYSEIHSEEISKENKKLVSLGFIIYPFLKFIVNFLIKKGYKDGIEGFVYSIMMSFHSFLSWSSLYLKTNE